MPEGLHGRERLIHDRSEFWNHVQRVFSSDNFRLRETMQNILMMTMPIEMKDLYSRMNVCCDFFY